MTSETAIECLEDLRAEGLEPTFADIIRLNALGLKLEAAHKKRVLDSTKYLPRVAVIGEVSFRQPTIGHEIWLDKINRLIKAEDFDTLLAIKAFCLSRPCDELPDADDPKSVTAAIEAYAKELSPYTVDQVYAALDYAINGADPKRGEFGPDAKRQPDGSELEDWEYCVAAGILHEGTVALYGVSVAELRRLTRYQVRDMIDRSFFYHQIEIERNEVRDAQADFYGALDEIRTRLTSHKSLTIDNRQSNF